MKKKISLFLRALIGALSSVIVGVLPISGMPPAAHYLLAVMTFVIFFWITEPIPLWATSLLGSALCVLIGIVPMSLVLSSFLDPILFLFIGSFLLARAMHVHGLDNRIAHGLLSHPWINGNSHRTLWAFGLAAWLLAMWLSITTTVAMLFPAALIVARAVEKTDKRYATALLLILPYAASAGAMASPIGTPPNLIGLAFMKDILGQKVSFLQWMIIGLPVALALLVIRYGILICLFHPPAKNASKKFSYLHEAFHPPLAWTHAEKTTCICFLAAVVLWVIGLPPGAVAMLAAGILFLLRILRAKDILHIDWGTVLLFGGGIVLGRAMFDTGLGHFLGNIWLKPLLKGDAALLTLAAILAAVAMSEIASNTAAANVIIPLILSATGTDTTSSLTLAFAATLGTSLGFMLPVSTPANAMVYGSGFIRLKEMIRAGILVDVAGIPLVWAAATWLVPLILK